MIVSISVWFGPRSGFVPGKSPLARQRQRSLHSGERGGPPPPCPPQTWRGGWRPWGARAEA